MPSAASEGTMNQSIAGLKNLGPKSAEMLASAGIQTKDDLQELGPVVAFLAVKQAGHAPSLNLLWAIAAALEDIHWLELTEETKSSLQAELEELTR